MRVVVRREMLGAREQAWSIFSGKEIIEMTSNQIRSLVKSGTKVCGLKVGKGNELELDKEGFYTTNIMEHRYCGSYKPMIDNDVIANLFYTVIGKNEEAGTYEVISSRFEHTTLTEADVRSYLKLGVICSGAKLDAEGNIVIASVSSDSEKQPEVKEEKKQPEIKKVEIKLKSEDKKEDIKADVKKAEVKKAEVKKQ
jgi:hypothetical protein